MASFDFKRTIISLIAINCGAIYRTTKMLYCDRPKSSKALKGINLHQLSPRGLYHAKCLKAKVHISKQAWLAF